MLLSVVFLLMALLQAPAPGPRASPWGLPPGSPVTLEVAGTVLDDGGATITINREGLAISSPVFVNSMLLASSFRRRRVTFSADLETVGTGAMASLFVSVNSDSEQLLTLSSDEPVRGDRTTQHRSVTFILPAQATRIFLAIILGTGSVTAHDVRLEAGPELTDLTIAPEAQRVLDAALNIVKQNAYNAGKVDWTVVEPRVREMALGAERSADVYSAIRYLLGQLHDGHSFFNPPSQADAFRSGGASNAHADVRIVAENIGYVGVPGYVGAEESATKAYVIAAHDALTTTLPSVSCGWIVDLRDDTGGNMYPMLAGLKPFLGPGPHGSFVRANQRRDAWRVDEALPSEPPAALAPLESAWVAVLTGPRTGSSGEAVTVAFRGREHTRSFGAPTAGLSSANATFPLPDRSLIFVMSGIDADRTGRTYGGKIEPDEPVATSNDGGSDRTLDAAVRWLRESTSCQSR